MTPISARWRWMNALQSLLCIVASVGGSSASGLRLGGGGAVFPTNSLLFPLPGPFTEARWRSSMRRLVFGPATNGPPTIL